MGFHAGDTYNFILNIPTKGGSPTVISPPIITVLDINNPGTPIVTGAAMTLITGTDFLYFYSLASPNASPKDYVAIYSYSVSNAQSLGTALVAYWGNGLAHYKFPLPLPVNVVPGSTLTTLTFTPSGFNVAALPIQNVSPDGTVTVAVGSNPGTPESFNLTGNAQIVAGLPNVATVQVSPITNGVINPGDSITIASATSPTLNGSWVVNTAVLSLGVWTVTFYTSAAVLASTPQVAGTLADNNISLATVNGTGSAVVTTVVSNQLISLADDHLHIGDSYITGQVALDATVAKASIVAQDATVMKSSQYVSPTNDPTVQTINTATATILSNTNNAAALLGTLSQGTLSGLIQDVYDNVFGSWSIDQTLNPPVLYMKRINGTPIASFQLVNNNTVTQRNVLTSPLESSI